MRCLALIPLLALSVPALADEIALTGHIDAATAARLHAVLADGKAHTLGVNSSGGDDAPALALAQDLRRGHAQLVADSLCAGPCADDLFIAATDRSVMPGGLVIFAATTTSRLAMVPAARRKELLPD